MMGDSSISLYELNRRLAGLIVNPSTQNVWVTAELSDVAVRGGHCYMELLQKDVSGLSIVAKARAACWANVFRGVRSKFFTATGQDFASGIKVMVKVSASFHPIYGLSLVVTDVNPEFTMGDLLRRRREILARLKAEGVLDLNRELKWPGVPQRIAIISSPGAAGYGDFIDQLFRNPLSLRFNARLFPALMQGDKAAASIISALEKIAGEQEEWDCVVMIRGGGATSDLNAFEDYRLAYNIACFPLPVICGIGHERDVTVLDYVANMRVKTPTAAAAWLISRGENMLEQLSRIATDIHRAAAGKLAAEKQRLAYCEGILPIAPVNAVERAGAILNRSLISLSQVSARRIAPQLAYLASVTKSLPPSLSLTLSRAAERLDNAEKMINVLSPAATLARGYSITRIKGHAITSVAEAAEGAEIETLLNNGQLISTITRLTR